SVSPSAATTDLAVKYFNGGIYTSGIWNNITIPATGTIGNVTTGAGNIVTQAPAFHTLVLPATTLPANTNTLRAEVTIDGAVYTVALNVQTENANKWEAGKHYTYNLTLKGKELVVSTVTVNQWTQGGSSDIEI
ncbi:MAG: fimbrillin family protein, partial [Bacteroidales bacterium]